MTKQMRANDEVLAKQKQVAKDATEELSKTKEQLTMARKAKERAVDERDKARAEVWYFKSNYA